MDPVLLLAFTGIIAAGALTTLIALVAGRMILLLRAAVQSSRRKAERGTRRKSW